MPLRTAAPPLARSRDGTVYLVLAPSRRSSPICCSGRSQLCGRGGL